MVDKLPREIGNNWVEKNEKVDNGTLDTQWIKEWGENPGKVGKYLKKKQSNSLECMGCSKLLMEWMKFMPSDLAIRS